MNLLMLTCLSIRSATETANANIKKALLGYFTINAKQLATGITEDTVEQILDIGGVSGRFTLRSNTYATYLNAEGELLEINTEGAAQVPEGFENAGKIVANPNSQNDSYFTDGGFELVEGEPITTQGGSQVLIHEKFPQRNGLSVGDTMLLGNVEDVEQTIPVTVAGIFTNTEEQDSIGMAPSMSIRSRKRETGILLAVGIAKPSVILQYALETMLIAIVAFPLAYLSSRQAARTLETLFGKTAATSLSRRSIL